MYPDTNEINIREKHLDKMLVALIKERGTIDAKIKTIKDEKEILWALQLLYKNNAKQND